MGEYYRGKFVCRLESLGSRNHGAWAHGAWGIWRLVHMVHGAQYTLHGACAASTVAAHILSSAHQPSSPLC